MTTASAHVSPRSIDDTYRNACLAKRTDCSSQGFNIADDLCLSSSLLEEAKVTEANQCLDKSCADIRSCLTAIFQ
jgi:hypothetical protein